jgi:hypothetical protein
MTQQHAICKHALQSRLCYAQAINAIRGNLHHGTGLTGVALRALVVLEMLLDPGVLSAVRKALRIVAVGRRLLNGPIQLAHDDFHRLRRAEHDGEHERRELCVV